MQKLTSTVLLLFLLAASLPVIAQQKGNAGINESAPHPSAILHLSDKDRMGFKIPYTDTNAVQAYANSFAPPIPIANGLLIFQKGAETFYFYNAPLNKWVPLSGLTGPTGPKGDTGVAGPTGPVSMSAAWRWGIGAPVRQAGDTCNMHYVNVETAEVYRMRCPGMNWTNVGGTYENIIRGGRTSHKSSLTLDTSGMPATGTSFVKLNNLSDTITVPLGYVACVLIKAHGTVQKRQPNNDYNYAKFRFRFNGVNQPNTEQVVSMGPNGLAPNNVSDNVMWAISYAGEFAATTIIDVMGGQLFSKASNGNITLCGGPGSENAAHLEVFVIYKRT